MATIRKRGSSWQAQVIRRGHRPAFKSFPTKAEAQAWARRIEADADSAAESPAAVAVSRRCAPTLREALDRYASTVVPTKRWVDKELQRVRFLQRQSLAHLLLTEIRASDLASCTLQ